MRSLMGLMAQPVAIVILAMTIITPALANANLSSSVIDATCAALKHQAYSYCVGVISADPAAANVTDARGVAAVAVNITAHKANSTLQNIISLIVELNSCREYYGDMQEQLASILTDIRNGRRIDDAMLTKVENAIGAPESCDVALIQGNAGKDPFSDENYNNDGLAELVHSIVTSIAT